MRLGGAAAPRSTGGPRRRWWGRSARSAPLRRGTPRSTMCSTMPRRDADEMRAAAEVCGLVVAAEPADHRHLQLRHQARRPPHPAVHQIWLEVVDQLGELAPAPQSEPAVQHIGGERHARRRQPLMMDRCARDHRHLLQRPCLQARHHIGGIRLGATIGAARHDVQDAHVRSSRPSDPQHSRLHRERQPA